MTFSVPFSANKIGSIPVGGSTLTYINFNDSSEIHVSVTDNTSGVPFSDATSEQLYEVLESYANSFSSTFTDKGTLERVTITDGIACKQDMKKDGNLTIVLHVLYNDRIYTIGFIDTQGDDTTTAPSIADDVIKSIKFTQTESVAEPTTAKVTEPTTTKPIISTGQENALKKAKQYIEYTPMSLNGLIEQLEYEGFSNDEAQYGAENCGADWNEQAVKNAEKYIDYSGFSYTKLIEQLEYEKFSHEQAVYGADNCGADWYAEAAESAQKYMDYSSMSRERLLDQLLYEGYTQEQAEYGLSSVGY